MSDNIDRRSWRLEYFEEGFTNPYLIETLWSLEEMQFATGPFAHGRRRHFASHSLGRRRKADPPSSPPRDATLRGWAPGRDRIAAGTLGVFQQIQKSERGKNRVSAQRLLDICKALNVPLSSMFDHDPNGQ
jgi:hypothetical protein